MKRTYHTDIAIQYKLGLLNTETIRQIPSSTLNNWKNKDFSTLFGSEAVYSTKENIQMITDFLSKKYLIKAARAVYIVYSTYKLLLEKVKDRKRVLRQHKDVIIQTIDKIKDSIGLKRALKAFNISCQQYYAWKRNIACKLIPAGLCRKRYYNQITMKEVNTIKSYLKNPKYLHWNVTSVYYQMLRDKAAFTSQTTYYKYVNILKLNRHKPFKKKYDIGIRASGAKKILHMDVTIYKPLDHSRVYLYFLVDNFSRYILNWKASLSYSAKVAFKNIKEAYDTYGLQSVRPHVDLITDGGSENKGQVEKYITTPGININKIVAQTDIVFSNSMVEAVNKRIKYDFLYNENLLNFEQTVQYLIYAVNEYNNKPHSSLFGSTPYEVFNGIIPDKDMFKPAMQHAAAKRKDINMNQECLNCV